MATIVTFDVPGYGEGLHVGVPKTNDMGGNIGVSQNYKIPPAIWMIVFIVGAYIGLRMLMD